MNNLYESLIDEIMIGGETHYLNLSFDNVLAFFAMSQDEDIDPITKVQIAFNNFVPRFWEETEMENPDIDILIKTVSGIVEFLKSDEPERTYDDLEDEEDIEEGAGDTGEEYYCLNEDAPYIYASFRQEYNIDLFEQHGILHWFKFRSLLDGMRDDTKFKEIVGIRAAKLPTGKGTEQERKRLKALKKVYALKKNQAQVEDDLAGMFNFLAGKGSE